MLYVALFLHDIAKGRDRGPFDRRRAGGAALLPAAGPFSGRDRDCRLAGRKSSRHVERGAVARPVRPQDHREFRRGRADDRTPASCSPAHDRRHPRGRAGRVERLEGAVAAHALLRDRAGPHRRPFAESTASSASPVAQDELRRALPAWPIPSSTPMRRATIRPTGSRSICRTGPARASSARRRSRRQDRSPPTVRRPSARRHRTDGRRARSPAAAVDHRRRLRDGGRQHRRRADLHDHRRAGARHDLDVARFDRDEDEMRRAKRVARAIEKALRGELRLTDVVGQRRRREAA